MGFPDPAGYISSGELILSMKEMLWPEASDDIKDGTWDSVYRPLTQSEIDDLIKFWNARKEQNEYESQSWDCDNFSLEFYYLATVWNMRVPAYFHPPPPAVGIALVKVDGWYPLTKEPRWVKMYHAINVILRDDGQWLFFEPQNGCMMPIDSMMLSGDFETIRIIL